MSDAPKRDDPRMRGFRSRSSVESLRRLIDDRVRPIADAGPVALIEAAGRVLAEAIAAPWSVPGFDRAAMDGYALRGEETFGSDAYSPAAFRVIGRSRPGEPFAGRAGPGEAVEIATGAAMPAGADAVAKAESSRREGDRLQVVEPTPPRRHVGHAGEDVARGATVFDAGRALRPQDLGLLSALGVTEVRVIRRPRVAILVTGDEVLPAGSPPDGCRIADMNGPMLSALAARDGATPRLVGPLRDDRARLREAIAEAAASSDFVIVSGGSSTGPEDHAPTLVAELGELPIHGVALRPASPTGLGFVGDTPVLLAPGNPVSSLCAYDLFGGRIARRLGGRPPGWSYRPLDAPLADKIASPLGRADYVRVILQAGRVVPIATSGASILSSAVRADGFVLIPADSEGHPAGNVVRVWLYDDPARED